MKKGLVVLVLFALALTLSAQTSIATTDNFMAPKVNPAAIGVGNASGISFIGNYDEDGIFEDYYSLIIGGDNVSYVLDRVMDDNYHRLAMNSLKSDFLPNVYFGLSWDWKNKHFKQGDIEESILIRPNDYLSMGAVVKGFFDDKTTYDFGIAVRPVFFESKWTDKLTISADTNYDRENFSKPVVGVQTEILDGIKLGGSYNMENETIGIDFGISFGNFGIGSSISADTENEFSHGQYYLSASEKAFKTIIGTQKNYFLDYKLTGEIVEKNPVQKFGPFKVVMSKGKTLSGLIKEIEKLKKDENVKGLVFKSSNFSARFAQRAELKKAFLDFKSAGKSIVFYYEGISGANYAFAASIADQIYLNPIGSIDLKGISVNMPYFKDLLDTLGVDVINLKSHDYKTAGNSISESNMTDAERETYEALLDDLFDEIVMMIKEGRGEKLTKSVEQLIDEGPYWDAELAFELGLIDGVIYEDELEDKIKDNYQSAKIVEKYQNEVATTKWSKSKKDKVALIYAVGSIHSGEGTPGKSIGSVTTAKAIKQAREDKSVKGIIIRVDSGGGSALASDVIGREVELCKTGKNAKPVIVSMGGVAASGGYYIAAKADKIIAHPSTITGSIGVIGIFPIFERLYEKIHVNWNTVKKGKHADLYSTHRFPTEEEQKMGQESIKHFYDRFIGIVAEGRDLSKEDVHKIAQGRVWTGKKAFQLGLVDALGGMDLAVTEMKKMAELKHEVKLVEFEGDDDDNSFKIGMNASSFIPEGLKTVWDFGTKMKKFEGENILMILPVEPEIK
ncbi:MAG: signal peptide peptidase SppA [Candidatus Cloacimonetes bacterium]|nr:signal peptide peptidase SppA [Candidatus Cloacimonadota bacterium]